MRKIIFSVLMVLLLSLVLLGCGKDPCEVCGEEDCICKSASASALDAKAIAFLTGMGLAEGDVLTPMGTTLHDSNGNTGVIQIIWKDANKAMFDKYHAAWLARSVTQNVSDKSKFITASIDFFDAEGTSASGIQYPAGSISFYGQGIK